MREDCKTRPEPATAADLSGRDRIARNVAASWGGYLVFVAAGFVLPRLIDRRLGQSALGVWDFAWSLVSYFELAQVGIGSSVNRFVAECRARGDARGLAGMVSSVMVVQAGAAVLALLLTFAASAAVPALLGARGAEARAVVWILGGGIAVQMALNAYTGVITGCHRWDVHNGLGAAGYALTVAGMIAVLSRGGGLRGLALASFAGTVLTEASRVVAAYRLCPELRVRLRFATLADARRALAFGGKTLVGALSRLLLYQTSSLLVAGALGAGALAAYARPNALCRHAQTLVDKFSFVLTPTASYLQARGDRAALERLVVGAGRAAAHIALPIVAFLTVLGDPLLRLWMGPRYEQGAVLAILALGHVFALTQQPVQNVLVGMDLHGRPGLARLVAALASAGLGALVLGPLGMGLAGAALAVAVPLTAVKAVYVPIYACRRLGIPLGRYFRETLGEPLRLVLPFALFLAAGRIAFLDRPLMAVLVGGTAGGAALGALYWRHVLPPEIRARARARFPRPIPGIAP